MLLQQKRGNMDDVIKMLLESPLFQEIDEEKMKELLLCLDVRKMEFEKGQLLFAQETALKTAGFLLEGSLSLEREDFWGNRSILAVVRRGEIFGEVYACRQEKRLNINIKSLEKTQVLFMNLEAVFQSGKIPEDARAVLLRNLVGILADKTYYMSRKAEVLSARTTREKLMSYLSAQAQEAGKNEFQIPFKRQEMADFLSVDRSAMCRELGKMQQEGILSFSKRRFCLKGKKERIPAED